MGRKRRKRKGRKRRRRNRRRRKGRKWKEGRGCGGRLVGWRSDSTVYQWTTTTLGSEIKLTIRVKCIDQVTAAGQAIKRVEDGATSTPRPLQPPR